MKSNYFTRLFKLTCLTIFSISFVYSCQTLRRSGSSLTTSSSGMAILQIDGSERDELITTLQAQRLRHGLRDEARLITYSARAQCHVDGSLEACFVRSKLGDAPYFSSGNELTRRLTQDILRFAHQTRNDLKGERIITANVLCDVTTSSAPPYSDRNASCYMHAPRRSNEGYLHHTLAQETLRSMVESTGAKQGTAPPQGNVNCRWPTQEDGRVICYWQHPGPEGTAKTETQVQNSEMLASVLLSTHRYHRSIYSPELRQAQQDPRDIQAAVICMVPDLPATKGSALQTATTCRVVL